MENVDILLRLIIAHLLADFLFQTDKINTGKKKGISSGVFWIHILIVGATTYLLLGQWSNWYLPLIVMILHGGIDYIKIRLSGDKENVWLYAADQFFHLLTIVAVWSFFYSQSILKLLQLPMEALRDEKALIVLIAFLIVTYPIGYLIGMFTQQWRQADDDGLPNAGKTIGFIERTLILIFVLAQQWEAIGFLLAAKSVFRFGDLNNDKDRRNTEYILIGTLLSFALSIVVGIFTLYLLELA